jgi:uncharacterized protein YndB with AHSA1/START domain
MQDGPSEGYLLIADISGYTAFLAGTELEHAHGILAELTNAIVDALTPPMRLAKLEGDAVFCVADASVFADGERLLELIESSYVRFLDTVDDMRRSTTCTCAACAAIGTLDLKFVAHFGAWVQHAVAGAQELSGADVILTHRLLKNSIARDGMKAYAFVTAAAIARCATPPELATHSETYESFGVVRGGVHDLAASAAVLRDARRNCIEVADADMIITRELPAPPAVVWSHLVEPAKRLAWQQDLTGFENRPNRAGRMSTGAESHCAHGNWASVLRYTDVRPFHYVTTELEPTKRSLSAAPPLTTTMLLEEAGDGRTLFHMRVRVRDRGAGMRLMLLVLKPMFRRSLGGSLDKLEANLRRT